jgi:predicted chitinase
MGNVMKNQVTVTNSVCRAIQLTGKDNYTRFANSIGMDVDEVQLHIVIHLKVLSNLLAGFWNT